MSRQPDIWWNKQKSAWCTDLGGHRKVLAKGKAKKKQAQDKLRALLDEQSLLATVGGTVTVAGLCEAFLADADENLEPMTYRSYQYGCQKFVDLFGKLDAHTVEPADIQRFSRELKASVGDTTRAIILRTVQRCFNWGVEMRMIPPHQLGRIRKPQPKSRDRYLSDEEFKVLLNTCRRRNGFRKGGAFRCLLQAMDWTLCRPGELARLKWENLHLDQDVAILPHHKTKRTGKPKIIPLIPKMKRLLSWLRRRSTSEYCLVNSRGQAWTISAINQRMDHAKRRSGLTGICPYTIRHRAATNSILRTGDLKMTSLLLGHTSTTTTERYTHLAQEHLVNFARRATDSRRDA